MPIFTRQNEVNMAKEPPKVQQPLLENSSEMDKLPCIATTEHSPVTKTTARGTSFSARIGEAL